jgi:hypothetical protein
VQFRFKKKNEDEEKSCKNVIAKIKGINIRNKEEMILFKLLSYDGS